MVQAFLNYGYASQLELELPLNVLVAECHAPRGEPIDDLFAAVRGALEEPLDYPPLSQATVPGDHVAVVLDDHLPQSPAFISGTIEALLQGGVEPDHVVILQSQAGAAIDPRDQLEPALAGAVRRVIHDPEDRGELSYLASNASDEAIYLNREICEADLVLPIGCLRMPSAPDYRGPYGVLFPTFADAATIHRGREFLPAAKSKISTARKAADEVGWLLGIRLLIQIVPGAAGSVLHVVAGDVDAVAPLSERLCEAAWRFRVPSRTGLVVASIEGNIGEQTWGSLARAIASAEQVVEQGGAIAICSDLAAPPGRAVSLLADLPDVESALAQIRRLDGPDAAVAGKIAGAIERGPVYLLSQLEDEVVESLGIAPLSSSDEILRLATRFGSCTLLSGAQHVMIDVEEP